MKCKPIFLSILSLLGIVLVSGLHKTQPQTLSVAAAQTTPKYASLSKVPRERVVSIVYPSPDGRYFLTYDPIKRDTILCDRSGKTLHTFNKKLVGFCCSSGYCPWAEERPICFLVQEEKESRVTLLRYDVVHNRTSTFSFRGTVLKLVASPDGRYALVDGGVTVGSLSTPLGPAQIEVLLLWDSQVPVNKLNSPVDMATFRFMPSSMAWVKERSVFVYTAGRNLGEKAQDMFHARLPLLVGENYLVSAGTGLYSEPLAPMPYESLVVAPYADATGRLIGLAGKAKKHYLVSIDPATGASHVEKELPASTKSPWLLTWSSPQRMYVWRWRQAGEIEVYVYRSLARPHVGALQVVKVPMSISFVADSAGRVWGYDGKALRYVQLPLQ